VGRDLLKCAIWYRRLDSCYEPDYPIVTPLWLGATKQGRHNKILEARRRTVRRNRATA
jgi:hypothetical protein